jgi:L-serine dehydratase
MLACRRFIAELREKKFFTACHQIRVELYGSLALTGMGHGIDKAIFLGLEGEVPESIDLVALPERLARFKEEKSLCLDHKKQLSFDTHQHVLFHRRTFLPRHPNGMTLSAFDSEDKLLHSATYYSVGGGAVISESDAEPSSPATAKKTRPFPFTSGKELLALCQEQQCAIWEIMWANELALHDENYIREHLNQLWQEMSASIDRGCVNSGTLPGGLKVQRRAPELFRTLSALGAAAKNDPLSILDWVNLYAMAVNEENAAGARIVTAPTNGAAGVIPATMRYYVEFSGSYRPEGIHVFLLTAAAVGFLYVHNASISGAQVGCQGEVGVACSMAAAGLAAVLGGSTLQVEQAAEIAMEHNLGLTCDPIGGLVQIPCIERNAMGAVKAINAARLALKGDGTHFVSLDSVIKTMKQTGEDMKTKYKETSRGGLAVNVIEC